MKRTFVFAATASLLVGACTTRTSQAVGTPVPITFANLDARSHIQVYYESDLAYHHFCYYFTFDKTPVLRVTVPHMGEIPHVERSSKAAKQVYHVRWMNGNKPGVVLKVSAAQAAQLDDLLAVYRHHKSHRSATESKIYDTVTFIYTRDGKTINDNKMVVAETFKDSSGLRDIAPAILAQLSGSLPLSELKRFANIARPKLMPTMECETTRDTR